MVLTSKVSLHGIACRPRSLDPSLYHQRRSKSAKPRQCEKVKHSCQFAMYSLLGPYSAPNLPNPLCHGETNDRCWWLAQTQTARTWPSCLTHFGLSHREKRERRRPPHPAALINNAGLSGTLRQEPSVLEITSAALETKTAVGPFGTHYACHRLVGPSAEALRGATQVRTTRGPLENRDLRGSYVCQIVSRSVAERLCGGHPGLIDERHGKARKQHLRLGHRA